MMLERLAGNELLRRDLCAALKGGWLAHSILLCGEKGMGAGFAARCLAADYLCPDGGPAAEAVLAGRGSECIEVRGEGASGGIKVERVREVRRMIQSTSLSAAGRVVIIYDAHMLNASSGNALLKSIEEPPRGVLFLLTAPSAAALLPTIRSRCAVYTLSPVSEADCAALLRRVSEAGNAARGDKNGAAAAVSTRGGNAAGAQAGRSGAANGAAAKPARAGAGAPSFPVLSPEQLAALYAGEIGRALDILQEPSRAAVLADALRLAELAAKGQEYPLLVGFAAYETAKKPRKAAKKPAAARWGEKQPEDEAQPADPLLLLLHDLACIGSAVLRGNRFCGLSPQRAERLARGAEDALRALAGNVSRRLVLTNLAIALAEP